MLLGLFLALGCMGSLGSLGSLDSVVISVDPEDSLAFLVSASPLGSLDPADFLDCVDFAADSLDSLDFAADCDCVGCGAQAFDAVPE